MLSLKKRSGTAIYMLKIEITKLTTWNFILARLIQKKAFIL